MVEASLRLTSFSSGGGCATKIAQADLAGIVASLPLLRDVPELLVVNKTDIATADEVHTLLGAHADSLAVSAASGEGIEKLVDLIGQRLRALARIVELVIPYDRGDVLAALHRDADVLVEVHADDGARGRARIPDRDLTRLASFIVTE